MPPHAAGRVVATVVAVGIGSGFADEQPDSSVAATATAPRALPSFRRIGLPSPCRSAVNFRLSTRAGARAPIARSPPLRAGGAVTAVAYMGGHHGRGVVCPRCAQPCRRGRSTPPHLRRRGTEAPAQTLKRNCDPGFWACLLSAFVLVRGPKRFSCLPVSAAGTHSRVPQMCPKRGDQGEPPTRQRSSGGRPAIRSRSP